MLVIIYHVEKCMILYMILHYQLWDLRSLFYELIRRSSDLQKARGPRPALGPALPDGL